MIFYYFLALLVLLAGPACWWLRREADRAWEATPEAEFARWIALAADSTGQSLQELEHVFTKLEKTALTVDEQVRGLADAMGRFGRRSR